MNYNHQFHAGNFADIFKHLILIFCLEKLHEKSSSFLAIDTHSSCGKFNIFDEKILKTNEFNEGLNKILKNNNFKEILPINYLKILAKINCCEIDEIPSKIKVYSGSAMIIKNFLRSQDKAIFAETHSEIFYQLSRNFTGNKKILCIKEDGFSTLKSKLPSLEKRNLILIDPAFEKINDKISADYQKILIALHEGYKRCNNAIFIIWHPIIDGEENLLNNFYNNIASLNFSKIHHIIIDIGKNIEKPLKLHSCGMFIINMPWQIDNRINEYFPKALQILKNSEKNYFKIKTIKDSQ
jgi:23S rRNA (adenine2030-N6)-methyltransferase